MEEEANQPPVQSQVPQVVQPQAQPPVQSQVPQVVQPQAQPPVQSQVPQVVQSQAQPPSTTPTVHPPPAQPKPGLFKVITPPQSQPQVQPQKKKIFEIKVKEPKKNELIPSGSEYSKIGGKLMDEYLKKMTEQEGKVDTIGNVKLTQDIETNLYYWYLFMLFMYKMAELDDMQTITENYSTFTDLITKYPLSYKLIKYVIDNAEYPSFEEILYNKKVLPSIETVSKTIISRDKADVIKENLLDIFTDKPAFKNITQDYEEIYEDFADDINNDETIKGLTFILVPKNENIS